MIKQAVNPVRPWVRIVTALYPLQIYIFFIHLLLAVHIRGLDNFTFPIVAALYLFLPFAFDAQKRWISWAWRTVKQFSPARRVVAIALIAASLGVSFAWTHAINVLVWYTGIAFVSGVWGVRVERGESTS